MVDNQWRAENVIWTAKFNQNYESTNANNGPMKSAPENWGEHWKERKKEEDLGANSMKKSRKMLCQLDIESLKEKMAKCDHGPARP